MTDTPSQQTGRIFISYRRADSAGYAGRIYDRLATHFGKEAIFMDVDTIQAGMDFVDVLENAVQSCDVVVALLGRQWLNIKDDAGKRRLDNPQDFVRIEVAAALSRRIRVIPVLVDGTPMPNADQLPNSLKLLARRNAVLVNHPSFHNDANRLIEQLDLALKAAEESKILKAKELKEKKAQEKLQAEIENLLSQADIALDLQEWELAKEKLEAVLILESNHGQAQIKLAIVERKLQEIKEKILAEEKAKQEADEKTEREKAAKEKLAREKAQREMKEAQEKRQIEIEKLLSQVDIAFDLQEWELAKEKLTAILMLEPDHVQAQIKLASAERKQREKKGNAERNTAEKVAIKKAEFEKEAREEAERVARQNAKREETVTIIKNFLQSKIFKFIWIGATGMAVIAFALWGLSNINLPTAPTEAEGPTAELTATEEPMPEPTEPPMAAIGSPEHPIKVLFVPYTDSAVIVSGGEIMAAALNEATGLTFEVVVPTSYAATIEEMCASPSDTMGFIPSLGYALASQLCDVDVAFKAVRFGYSVYWSQILVSRDSDIQSIEDLEGKKWGYVDPGSTTGFMVPLEMFKEAGINVILIETGSHNSAALAVYNGSVDFATTYYSPYLSPEGGIEWSRISPDIPDSFVESCAPNAEGSRLFCGPNADYRVLDARAGIRNEAPDIIQQVRILVLSPDIPNDTLSFSPEFPADVRARIETAFIAFAETEAWEESIGNLDFYGWTGIDPATDAEYDFVRKMVETAGLSLKDLGD